MNFNLYYQAVLYLKNSTIDLSSTLIKLAFITSDYVPNLDTDSVWADVSSYEVPVCDNYPAGGFPLVNSTLSRVDEITTWNANDIHTNAIETKEFRFIVLYQDETVNTVVTPLIGVIYFNPDGDEYDNIVLSNMEFILEWNVDGICQFGTADTLCL